MIENIESFLSTPEAVRTIIQESINKWYNDEAVKKIPWGEYISIRTNTANITKSRFDKKCHVFLPDEVNPIALAEYLVSEMQYKADKELVLAVICRAMVKHINELYGAASGRNDLYYKRNQVFSEDLSKKQWMSIEKEYIRKLESRKGYKKIRVNKECVNKSL